MRLAKVEADIFAHEQGVEKAVDELLTSAESQIPKIRFLQRKAAAADEFYLQLSRQTAIPPSREELVAHREELLVGMYQWSFFMGDSAARLKLEADVLEEIHRKVQAVVATVFNMKTDIGAAVKDLRTLHRRLDLPGPVTTSVDTQTDDPDTSIDVSRINFFSVFLSSILRCLIVAISIP